MSPEKNSVGSFNQAFQVGLPDSWFSGENVQFPGLTAQADEIQQLSEDLSKKLAVYYYKRELPYLWVVVMGGTGTGKSTVFNAFSGKNLSATGVERPKTRGAVVYAHRACPVEKNFPFPSIQIERQLSENSHITPATGSPGNLIILQHEQDQWSHLIVVDTPDLDSVETENREIAEDLYLISDAVLFVSSQEKYADEVPYRFLLRILQENKPYFFLLNKAHEPTSHEEILEALRSQGIHFSKDRIWLIPYAPVQPTQQVADHPAFRDFVSRFLQEFSPEQMASFRQRQDRERVADLQGLIGRLLHILSQESQEARQWMMELDVLFQSASKELLREQKEHFTADSRDYLKAEIRKLFARYDVLAKPRRYVREAILTPLRWLGILAQSSKDDHRKELLKTREKIDLTPVQMVIEKFNRLVLERLSPENNTSPLYLKLRQPGVALSDHEIKELVWEKQEQLAAWLEQTFQELAKGIPKGKEWGIYSTSILWGVLILSFEATLGGGFTLIDAVLDSALAPFVTKGAVELFAYHEIQKVARDLAEHYQDGLLSVVQEQRDRYQQCLESLLAPLETTESLRALRAEMEQRKS